MLVIVPLVAVVAFAAVTVALTSGQAIQAERLRLLVLAGAEAGELVHRLQQERVFAVDALVGRLPGAVDSYLDVTKASDGAIDQFRLARSLLAELPEGTAQLLDRVDRQLGQLPALRQRVISGRGSASASVFSYRILIADLVSYRESMAQAGGAPAAIGDRMRATAALTRAAEFVGLQQVAVLRATELGELTPAAAQEITAARTGYTEAELTFAALAGPTWRQWMEEALTGSEMVEAQRLEDGVARLQPGDRLVVDHPQWTRGMTTRLQRLERVEQRVDAAIVDEVTRMRDEQRMLAAIQALAVIGIVIVLLALAVWLGRPMIRGLRHLRDAAHRVAYEQLPSAVSRLQDETVLGELTPRQFADRMPPPIPVRGKDELAEVASAFNSVHHAAVRVAAEQALVRVGIAAMLVNLARRGMGLADRLTAELDKVERDEQDPDRLAVLFRLDLLTMLLRRTNHSLLVLGGDASARAGASDESLPTVVRAAQGQIEQYERVDLAAVDDVSIKAGVVDDLAKLLAEVLDNACRYSPPQRGPDGLPRPDVVVFARSLGDRVVIQVIDEGVGIDSDRLREFNERMSSRPQLDLTAVRTMGLTVVGELANRHGIVVHLRQRSVRGTIAEITLPVDVFTTAQPSLPSRPATTLPALPAAAGKRSVAPAAPLFKPAQRPLVPSQRTSETVSVAADPGAAQKGAADKGIGDKGSGSDSMSTMAVPTVSAAAAMDDTIELPIFQQLASRWFATADSDSPGPQGDNGRAGGTTDAWASPADAGWVAAKSAAEPPTGGLTAAGLPKRIAKAQLVPGSVAEPTRPLPEYRDPATVGATMAAYSRGLNRTRLGRTAVPPTATDDQGVSA